ncbi:MAG: D-amino-acid transaminase [Alphaproteobacteria bacterium]
MPRIAYVNGRYLPHNDAAVHIEDRGFQFADGIYEVCAVFDGVLLDRAGHDARLTRSLGALDIAMPVNKNALSHIMMEVARRNRLTGGVIYVQVTRGVAARNHTFPQQAVRPSLIVTARPLNFAKVEERAQKGITAISHKDERWARCDIKSIALLPNVLARQAALSQGAGEAWLVDDKGFVTEGAASTAWIVDQDGTLITRPLSQEILPGITRESLFKVAAQQGIKVVERAFTIEEAQGAREAFVSAATAFVQPVTAIDGVQIGNGAPGSIALGLREAYIAFAKDAARRQHG